MSGQTLQKAIDLVTKATEEDKAKIESLGGLEKLIEELKEEIVQKVVE